MKKNKIYDCITFFQSNLLFELRFQTLKNIVDHFVICEATKTHVGRPKKIRFNYKKWKKLCSQKNRTKNQNESIMVTTRFFTFFPEVGGRY